MVAIVPYDPNWPAEFRAIATALRSGLGALALRIDHIGSTAVPGLDAKDVIDVQITTASLDERVTAALNRLGYRRPEGVGNDHRPSGDPGPDSEWEKLFFREPKGQRPTHTHLRVLGRRNQRYALLFRDYLRADAATARAYAELKRRLARLVADPLVYAEAKDPAADLVYLAAARWAATCLWQPGPPDA